MSIKTRKKSEIKTLAQQERERKEKKKLGNSKEILHLESKIEQLKAKYEQFFTGALDLQPEREHRELKAVLTKAKVMPFQTPEEKFKIKALTQRFSTLNDYWERTIRQKENGTYHKDIFKKQLKKDQAINLSELTKKNIKKSIKTAALIFSKSMTKRKLNMKKIEVFISRKAREIMSKTGASSVEFQVVKKDGKIGVIATPVDES